MRGCDDLTKFQLCQRLLLTANALNKETDRCAICEKVYSLDSDLSMTIRCAECYIGSHYSCTSGIFLQKGFYWKCQDCDEPEKNPILDSVIRNLRKILISIQNDLDVKEQSICDRSNLENDLESCHEQNDIPSHTDEEFEEDNYADLDQKHTECYPNKGLYCDICHFSTYDSAEFKSHVDIEDRQFIFVQESISSPRNDQLSCVKCNETLPSWSCLFEHVTKYHSRPSDFPQFGDMEWKYLMSLENHAKRACHYCEKQFDSSSDWIEHMESNLNQIKDEKNQEPNDVKSVELKCIECQPEQVFESQDALKIHNSTFHKRNKKFLCAFCSFDGNSAKDLNQHILDDHEGNFNKCPECDFEAWAHSVLRRHINTKHRKIKSLSCRRSSSKSILTSHISNEHSERELPDENAPNSTSSNVQFKCCFCSYETTSKKAFHQHFDSDHDGNRTQCLECDFKAPVISHLRRHIDSVHKGLKKFPCESCDHRATTKQGLERHVRVRHLDLKDLKCPHCDFKTSAPDALRAHAKKSHENAEVKKETPKRIYFGNRTPIPMVCRLCGEGAPTTNKLAAHFVDCHPFEKPFWCHQCNIGYETYYGIQNHNRKDHSEERHLCPICGYSTHGPQYLKRHYRRVREVGFLYV